MRRFLLLFAAGALLAATSAGQGRIEVTDIVDRPFAADFPAGGKLNLRVRSGDIQIVGSDQDRITVAVSGDRASEARKMKVRLDRRDGIADLRISGGSHKDLTITIGVPKKTDLYARIPFGEVSVENVVGNKDIELHAGDLTVRLGNPADYGRVDASVFTGEVDGDPFGEEHGGLFRSFKREGNGPYRLHAHVGAGQLTLR
ncbi:MAG TPA: hypothetical protein VMQ61_12445 [Thermoanaerobaculia bacterium]|nr:hypothetical protein [Thermoanaerobaculia bacterium]